MDDQRTRIMRDTPIAKAVMTMAIPSIIGLLVMAVYNMVDTMFVAWLGTQATGATQVVFPFMMAVSAIGLTFGIGGGSYISRLLGQGQSKRANQVASTNFYLAIGVGIMVTVVGLIFLEPILALFGATDTIMEVAKQYGLFIVLGATAQITNQTLNNLLRAEGSAKSSMIGMATGAVLNIILDPIFIFGLGLGVKGAAIATSLSQFITMLMLVGQYVRKRTILHLRFKQISLDKALISEVFKIGAPTFARQILMSVSMALLNQAAGLYGQDAAIAAMGIVMRTMMIAMYIIFGLSQGFQPVAGYNYGAKRFDRLQEALKFTIKVSMLISIAISALFFFFGKEILMIYKPSQDVITLALELKNYVLISTILMSFTNVIGVYYQAVGQGIPALILSISRQGLFLIPIVLILPRMIGLTGVFMAQPAADLLTLLVSLFMFMPTRQSLNARVAEMV